MFVIKRDGRKQAVHFDKITARITKLSYGLNPDFCDPVSLANGRPKPRRSRHGAPPAPDPPRLDGVFETPSPCAQVLVAQKVAAGVYKGVTTSELDELAAETAASLTSTHPDYAVVSVSARGASRVRAWPVELRPSRPFSAPCAAGGPHRRLQPAQKHAQVVQRDVSALGALGVASRNLRSPPLADNSLPTPASPLGAQHQGHVPPHQPQERRARRAHRRRRLRDRDEGERSVSTRSRPPDHPPDVR